MNIDKSSMAIAVFFLFLTFWAQPGLYKKIQSEIAR